MFEQISSFPLNNEIAVKLRIKWHMYLLCPQSERSGGIYSDWIVHLSVHLSVSLSVIPSCIVKKMVIFFELKVKDVLTKHAPLVNLLMNHICLVTNAPGVTK